MQQSLYKNVYVFFHITRSIINSSRLLGTSYLIQLVHQTTFDVYLHFSGMLAVNIDPRSTNQEATFIVSMVFMLIVVGTLCALMVKGKTSQIFQALPKMFT